MNHKVFFLLSLLLFVLSSCEKKKSIDQFDKVVINHFSQNPEDSLKLKAAKFLIKNIDGLKTLDTISVAENQMYFNALDSIYKSRGINKNISYTEQTGAIDSINKV